MAFKILNLGSKNPYFNRGYVVRGRIFDFGTVTSIQLTKIISNDYRNLSLSLLIKISYTETES